MDADNNNEINVLLNGIYGELMAEGAWIGHEYGFIYMESPYLQLASFMKRKGLDTSGIDMAYKKVTEEYNRILSDKSLHLYNDGDALERMDQEFLCSLALAARKTAETCGLRGSLQYS